MFEYFGELPHVRSNNKKEQDENVPSLPMRCSDIVDVDPAEPQKLPARTYKDPPCSARIVPC